MARVAGTCFFKVDGQQLETTVEGDLDVTLLKVKRETLKPGFYKETAQIPRMSGTFIFPKKFPKDVLSRDDLTITAELANGEVVTLQQAYVVDETVVKNADGTVDLAFEGLDALWH